MCAIFVKPTLECRMNIYFCSPACDIIIIIRYSTPRKESKNFRPNQLVKGIDLPNRVKEKMFAFSHQASRFARNKNEIETNLRIYIFVSFFNLASRPYMDLVRFQFFIVPRLSARLMHFLRNNEMFVFGPTINYAVFRFHCESGGVQLRSHSITDYDKRYFLPSKYSLISRKMKIEAEPCT